MHLNCVWQIYDRNLVRLTSGYYQFASHTLHIESQTEQNCASDVMIVCVLYVTHSSNY